MREYLRRRRCVTASSEYCEGGRGARRAFGHRHARQLPVCWGNEQPHAMGAKRLPAAPLGKWGQPRAARCRAGEQEPGLCVKSVAARDERTCGGLRHEHPGGPALRHGVGAPARQFREDSLDTENDPRKQRGGSVTVPDRVKLFLRENRLARYCNACIKKKLGLKRPQQAQQATAPLDSEEGFTRERGRCSECGRTRKVIRAN